MSKTNRRRGYEAQRDGERYRHSPMGGTGEVSKLADVHIGASWGGDNSNGHRGHAEAKRGAKKFVRSRIRFHENHETQRLAQLSCEDD